MFWQISFKGSQSSLRGRRISTEVYTMRDIAQQSYDSVSASRYTPQLNQCFLGVISNACKATCCGCDASHLVSDFLGGHARGLSMACNGHPHANARDFLIGAVCCVPSSVAVTDACVNVCGRDHDPLISTLISFCAFLTCLHLCCDDLFACLCYDRVVCHLQSDASSFPYGQIRGQRRPHHRQELPSRLD
jgi:hypothetical protein